MPLIIIIKKQKKQKQKQQQKKTKKPDPALYCNSSPGIHTGFFARGGGGGEGTDSLYETLIAKVSNVYFAPLVPT